MGEQIAPNYRGKGTSKDKVRKDGKPKHAGNFSYRNSDAYKTHFQSQRYRVDFIDGKLIIGDHTPAEDILPLALVELMLTDPNFEQYFQKGTHTRGGKKYDCWKKIYKPFNSGIGGYACFTYYEEICTEGDFKYNFPEY